MNFMQKIYWQIWWRTLPTMGPIGRFIRDLKQKELNEEDEKQVLKAHTFCINNRKILMQSKICGCFHFLKIFEPKEIQEDDWTDMNDDEMKYYSPHTIMS